MDFFSEKEFSTFLILAKTSISSFPHFPQNANVDKNVDNLCTMWKCDYLIFKHCFYHKKWNNFPVYAHNKLTFIYKCLYNYSRYANGGLLK